MDWETFKLGLPILMALLALGMSFYTHRENKRINLKLRLLDEVYDLQLKLDQLVLFDFKLNNISHSLTDMFFLLEAVRINRTLLREKGLQIPETNVDRKDWLVEQEKLSKNVLDRYIESNKNIFTPMNQGINYFKQLKHPSTEDISEVLKYKTHIQTGISFISEFEKEVLENNSMIRETLNDYRKEIENLAREIER